MYVRGYTILWEILSPESRDDEYTVVHAIQQE